MLPAAKAEQMQTEQAIFSKAWNMLKKYYFITRDNEVAWEAIVEEAGELYKLGEGTTAETLGKKMALATMCHIEKVCKERAGQ